MLSIFILLIISILLKDYFLKFGTQPELNLHTLFSCFFTLFCAYSWKFGLYFLFKSKYLQVNNYNIMKLIYLSDNESR